MDFIAGANYENASGRFRVLSVDGSILRLEYASGPQAGRVLTKRTVDMDRLATAAIEETSPPPADISRAQRPTSRKSTTARPRAAATPKQP